MRGQPREKPSTRQLSLLVTPSRAPTPHLNPLPGGERKPRQKPPARAATVLSWSLPLFAAALQLTGCGVHSGYPNHAPAPSLVEPGTSPHDNQQVYLQLIRKMQQQGAYYASLAHIDAYRLQYGNPPELRRLQADALRETGQGSAAVPIYRGLLRGDQSAAAWHGLGLIAASSGQNEEAVQDLQKAVDIEPINAAYLSDLGFARMRAHQIAAAREPLAKAAQLSPSDAKAVSNLALWSLLNGNAQQADAIMQQAKLPQATRDAVLHMAVQMRKAPAPAAKTTTTSASTTAVATTTKPVSPGMPHQVPVPPEFSGIPGGVLDRFGNTTSTHEANP
ncbi:Flp pilus assembly protein TadD, contains TPR repeats [Rhodanobacter glycinis]|uniref:Flp pilus assembly protein TadD, contains TPR repeats n=1 Tax=Rhodanobacter glycinis TaxID=582702 RepID=A0A1I4DWS9_9GAMM|nr:Flp pilus assembly protein TadD, contains TPR repeats [Rhodanobacter glycinis]